MLSGLTGDILVANANVLSRGSGQHAHTHWLGTDTDRRAALHFDFALASPVQNKGSLKEKVRPCDFPS